MLWNIVITQCILEYKSCANLDMGNYVGFHVDLCVNLI